MGFINKQIWTIAAATVGVVSFLTYFHWSILDPSNYGWILNNDYDIWNCHMGSYAFRVDSWHFPLCKTTMINAPEGMSIVHTDSNPLVSIIFKIFGFVFPADYQYYGWWIFICWILQAVLGYKIVYALTNDKQYALLSAALFCLIPAQINRFWHINLMGFWVFLWPIYLFIRTDIKPQQKEWRFLLVLLLGSMVHLYLLFMAMAIVITWISRRLLLSYKNKEEDLLKLMLKIGGGTVVLAGWMFSIGYLYNLPESVGKFEYGWYGMNLNAMFNPAGGAFSPFGWLPQLPLYGGQHEGFQYLGVGILLLFFITAAISLRKIERTYSLSILGVGGFLIIVGLFLGGLDFGGYQITMVLLIFGAIACLCYAIYVESKNKTAEPMQKLWWLILPAGICTIYAITHQLMLGEILLAKLPIVENGFLSKPFRILRSSGRFFWVPMLIFLIYALVINYKYTNKKWAIGVLLICVGLQWGELSSIYFTPDNSPYESPLGTLSKEIITSAKEIKFLGTYDREVAEYALLNKIKVNSFYDVHNTPGKMKPKMQVDLDQLKNGKVDEHVVYLLPQKQVVADNDKIYYHKVYSEKYLIFSKQIGIKGTPLQPTTTTIPNAEDAEKAFAEKAAKLDKQSIEKRMTKARNNSEWMEYIKRKAQKNNISVDSSLLKEVQYTLIQEQANN